MIEKDCPTCLYRNRDYDEEEPCLTCTHPLDFMRKFSWELDPTFKEEMREYSDCGNFDN